MSYEKHTWETGEVITAEKLNNIEDGIGEGKSSDIFIVKFTKNGNTYTADKTYNEVNNAVNNGVPVIGFIAGFDQVVLQFTGRSGDDPKFKSTSIEEDIDGTIYATTYTVILGYDNTVFYKRLLHKLQPRENS